MNKTRWGYSKSKKAIWFYKAGDNFRGMCWAWSKEDLERHFSTSCLTNLEYLEGLNKLKETLE